jgi:hypothetical protein
MSERTPGMTKEQQDLVNRIFNLVERVIAAYEYDVQTRRHEAYTRHPITTGAVELRTTK